MLSGMKSLCVEKRLRIEKEPRGLRGFLLRCECAPGPGIIPT
jgi:hypothetical protein